jgi:hypothetical protein
MRGRLEIVFWLLACAILLALGACAQASALPQQPQRITSAHIVLTSRNPTDHIRAFDKTTHDPQEAQLVYDALLKLPVMPSGTYFCPIDRGRELHLTFFSGSTVVAKAMVKPDGCEGAMLPDGSKRWAATDDDFWTTLEQAFDATRSEFYGSDPGYDRPPAPTAVAGQP